MRCRWGFDKNEKARPEAVPCAGDISAREEHIHKTPDLMLNMPFTAFVDYWETWVRTDVVDGRLKHGHCICITNQT